MLRSVLALEWLAVFESDPLLVLVVLPGGYMVLYQRQIALKKKKKAR